MYVCVLCVYIYVCGAVCIVCGIYLICIRCVCVICLHVVCVVFPILMCVVYVCAWCVYVVWGVCVNVYVCIICVCA